MSTEPEIKLLKTINGIPVFEQVELTDKLGIDSLDEAVILTSDKTKSGISKFEPVSIESPSPGSPSNHITSTTSIERLLFGFQTVPAPIIPMSLAVIALLIAITFGHV
ncbi:MAG: hypothetical protein M1511_18885 [Deltaproteobacteria bacterium]|nr:hypothetical protein [Deltaproteobacteria bacterium]